MGQQQLLLVILVTIIVGIATVVAINTFGSAADQANVDAVIQDIAAIGASAQGYYMRPDMLGGGGRTFDGITFQKFSFAGQVVDDTNANNENGEYVLAPDGDDSFTIEGKPDAAGGNIHARVCADEIVMGDYDPAGSAEIPGQGECDDLDDVQSGD